MNVNGKKVTFRISSTREDGRTIARRDDFLIHLNLLFDTNLAQRHDVLLLVDGEERGFVTASNLQCLLSNDAVAGVGHDADVALVRKVHLAIVQQWQETAATA